MVSAARDFEAFNEVSTYVQIVKASPRDAYRYAVVGIDGKIRSRGNGPEFMLDRAAYWEARYAGMVDKA